MGTPLLESGTIASLRSGSEYVPSPDELVPESHPIPRNRWMLVALLCTALLGGTGAFRWFHTSHSVAGANSEPLSLKVTRNGHDFDVSWNRLSKSAQEALAATLTIRDGAVTRTFELDAIQLGQGRFSYTPLFEELNFRLEIMSDDLRTQAESVQVLTWSARPPAETMPGLRDISAALK